MEKEFLEEIFYKSGVVITEQNKDFDDLLAKLYLIFCKNIKENIISKQALDKADNFFEYWRLFRFHNIKALESKQAIQEFKKLQIKDCYLVQRPVENLKESPRPAYHIVGEYDFSFVNSKEDFSILQEYIKNPTIIPFFVFDRIREEIGDELYIFDESLSWCLMFTHPKDIFLYQVKK